jgi:hypothetical protein
VGAGQHRSCRGEAWSDCPPAECSHRFPTLDGEVGLLLHPLHLVQERVVLVDQRRVRQQRERVVPVEEERRRDAVGKGTAVIVDDLLGALPVLEAHVPVVLDLVARPPRQLKRACRKEQDHCSGEDVALLFG